jgi:hypothetical protein
MQRHLQLLSALASPNNPHLRGTHLIIHSFKKPSCNWVRYTANIKICTGEKISTPAALQKLEETSFSLSRLFPRIKWSSSCNYYLSQERWAGSGGRSASGPAAADIMVVDCLG